VGLQYDEGEQVLLDAELRPVASAVESATAPEGEIISTDPPAGITVAPGQVIRVVVSAGPVRVDVPSLALLTLAEAEEALLARGLTLGTVTAENSTSVPKDVVIRTDPASGVALGDGGAVNMVVSTGLVRVPDVRTLTIGEATSQLTALGLQIAVEADNGCAGQLVTAQSLPPGDQPQGSAVTLRYCTGTP
jgi:serine/threonine-protein kinase